MWCHAEHQSFIKIIIILSIPVLVFHVTFYRNHIKIEKQTLFSDLCRLGHIFKIDHTNQRVLRSRQTAQFVKIGNSLNSNRLIIGHGMMCIYM